MIDQQKYRHTDTTQNDCTAADAAFRHTDWRTAIKYSVCFFGWSFVINFRIKLEYMRCYMTT